MSPAVTQENNNLCDREAVNHFRDREAVNTNRPGPDSSRPRVGVPWRTSQEEAAGNHPKIANYLRAVQEAGGVPVLLSLQDPQKLQRELPGLDAFVLPGSPSDVEPARYGAANRGHSAEPDAQREATDTAILQHAFAAKKPVLAICYGCQLLNVYLGGTLIQDISSELATSTAHRKTDVVLSDRKADVVLGDRKAVDVPPPEDDPRHAAAFEAGSRLAALAGGERAEINSSHHQAIAAPGKNLRVTARAPDGIIEGVEWTGDSNWVVGVQWHPERMPGNPLAERLFRDFVAAAVKRPCSAGH